ncbi:uncharacterized protein LOC144185660 isoform X2 [Stigmatopora nigra]
MTSIINSKRRFGPLTRSQNVSISDIRLEKMVEALFREKEDEVTTLPPPSLLFNHKQWYAICAASDRQPCPCQEGIQRPWLRWISPSLPPIPGGAPSGHLERRCRDS